MAYSPTTIANYYIKEKAKFGKLTPIKLIKLVYFAHSWYLTLTDGEKLVDERIQAWKYGPVFPSLFDNIKLKGKIEISDPLPYDREETISKDDAEFLERIWDMYGSYNGIELSAITHANDTSWQKIYKEDTRDSEIPNEEILRHYKLRLVD
ncbi:Panacea domain-containing protein [Flavimarina sp. Hel_I_48]|uniref:Panacea domain-containing protein n=1 Tax=Flavimarina sp. Hel_I_48 TaxID=1392488 RepID=UPI0004DF4EE4|nr:type II toxin-antitoxin system antitoxin SocA domain-containing protein [Flavimarina sp. Hel_I_48]